MKRLLHFVLALFFGLLSYFGIVERDYSLAVGKTGASTNFVHASGLATAMSWIAAMIVGVAHFLLSFSGIREPRKAVHRRAGMSFMAKANILEARLWSVVSDVGKPQIIGAQA